MAEGVLPRRVPWTSKPPGIALKIDSTHRLSRDLIFLGPFGSEMIDLVSGKQGIAVNPSSGNIGADPKGVAWVANTLSDGGIYWPDSALIHDALDVSVEFTLLVAARLDTAASFGSLFSIPADAVDHVAPFHKIGLFRHTAGTEAIARYSRSASSARDFAGAASGFFQYDGTYHTYGVTRKLGDGVLYKDGQSYETTSSWTTNAIQMDTDGDSTAHVTLLSRGPTGHADEGVTGRGLIAALWARSLSPEEVLEWHNNQYANLIPRTQLIPVGVPASAATRGVVPVSNKRIVVRGTVGYLRNTGTSQRHLVNPQFLPKMQNLIVGNVDGTGTFDLLTGESQGGEASSISTVRERSIQGWEPGGTEDGMHFDGVGNDPITDQITVLAIARGDSGNGTGAYVAGRHPAWFMSLFQADDVTRFGVTGATANFGDFGLATDGVQRTYIGSYDGANVTAYSDGALKDTTANTGNVDTPPALISVGTYHVLSDDLWNWVGRQELVVVWHLALPVPVIYSLMANPWQLLKDKSRILIPTEVAAAAQVQGVVPVRVPWNRKPG